MRLSILTGLIGVVLLGFIYELLRRRQLREKYAVLWMIVGVLVIPFAFFPHLLDHLAKSVGVASGVSLVLFLAVIFLLLVCVHLSWEASRLEEETRCLAEEIALINTRLAQRDQAAEALMSGGEQ